MMADTTEQSPLAGIITRQLAEFDIHISPEVAAYVAQPLNDTLAVKIREQAKRIKELDRAISETCLIATGATGETDKEIIARIHAKTWDLMHDKPTDSTQ